MRIASVRPCAIASAGRPVVVAGDGSQRRYLRDLSKILDLCNVEFTGAVSPDEMIALYNDSDIFVNASDIDNQPLSIIEAFAPGLPS